MKSVLCRVATVETAAQILATVRLGIWHVNCKHSSC